MIQYDSFKMFIISPVCCSHLPCSPQCWAGLGWAEHHFYSYERTRHGRAAHLSNNAVAAQAPVLVLIMLLLLIHPVMLR